MRFSASPRWQIDNGFRKTVPLCPIDGHDDVSFSFDFPDQRRRYTDSPSYSIVCSSELMLNSVVCIAVPPGFNTSGDLFTNSMPCCNEPRCSSAHDDQQKSNRSANRPGTAFMSTSANSTNSRNIASVQMPSRFSLEMSALRSCDCTQ